MVKISAVNDKPWKTGERPVGLEIILVKQTCVLPWSQFLYAEGSADRIGIAFATHDIFINGAGLDALLRDVAVQCVTQSREPTRTDLFQRSSEPSIREISIVKIDEQPG